MKKLAFHDLMPLRSRDGTKEPFDDWWKRLGDRIPNIPKVVAEDWIHRHVDSGIPFTFLPIERLSFELASWPVERFADVTYARDLGPMLDPDRIDLLAHTRLAKHMIEHRTWPVPIVVLDNADRFVDARNREVLPRWCVNEGHERFAYLYGLRAKGIAQPTHDVYVMTIKGAAARR